MVVTLSFDIEEFDFPLEVGKSIAFDRQLEVSTGGLAALLTLLDKYDIKATFYVTANYAQNCPEIVRRMVHSGHEIASHDYYHSQHRASNPAEAKRVLETITGTRVVGFRSPRLADVQTDELIRAGYRYNSSLNPTWIPFRYNNLRKSRSVFSEGQLVNYPASVSYPLRVPLFWLSFHVMNLNLYQHFAQSAMRRDGHLNLYFHPWEFSDQLTDTSFGVPFYIRRCSGRKLLAKMEQFLQFLIRKQYRFETTGRYLLGGLDEM